MSFQAKAPGDPERRERALGRSKLFWCGVIVGWALIVAGVVGALGNARHTKPLEWSAWIFGAALVHDALIAPFVLAAGAALRRIAPPGIRRAITAQAIVTGLIVLATLPIFSGLGVRPDNPSHLPRNYGTGLAIALGVAWGGTATIMGLAAKRRRRVN